MKWQDLAASVSIYPTASKDWNRIQLFFKACAAKEAELIAAGNVKDLEAFNKEGIAHGMAWLYRLGQVTAKAWAYIGRDPFKGERETARAFAKKWSLSDEFRKAMG